MITTRRQFNLLKKKIRRFLEDHPFPEDRLLMPQYCGGVDRFGFITADYLVAFCDVMDELYERHHNN